MVEPMPLLRKFTARCRRRQNRMATLAAGGRISVDIVESEIDRLQSSWSVPIADSSGSELDALLGEAAVAEIDPFDRVQLAEVVRVCRASRTMLEAGRQLFAVSRARKESPNDADRLRKYLARFGLVSLAVGSQAAMRSR
jgi:transcriptional regulatory protein RtcR